jgi:hypothetical protein
MSFDNSAAGKLPATVANRRARATIWSMCFFVISPLKTFSAGKFNKIRPSQAGNCYSMLKPEAGKK